MPFRIDNLRLMPDGGRFGVEGVMAVRPESDLAIIKLNGAPKQIAALPLRWRDNATAPPITPWRIYFRKRRSASCRRSGTQSSSSSRWASPS